MLAPRAAPSTDPHYFLGKSEILGWINDSLGLRLNKVRVVVVVRCRGVTCCMQVVGVEAEQHPA